MSINEEEKREVNSNAKYYLEAGKVIKENKSIQETSKVNLRDTVMDIGDSYGKDNLSKKVVTDKYSVAFEARQSISVDNDKAVKLFEDKGITDYEIKTTISLKSGKTTLDVPKKVIEQMNKYFDIFSEKTVRADVLAHHLEEKDISKVDFEKVILKKVSHAIRIKEV